MEFQRPMVRQRVIARKELLLFFRVVLHVRSSGMRVFAMHERRDAEASF